MRARPTPDTIRRLQTAAALAVVLGCAGLFAFDAWLSPRAPYLGRDARAAWIVEPGPVSAEAKRPRDEAARFAARFALAEPPAGSVDAALLLRTVGEAQVTLNGESLSGAAPLPTSPKRVLRLPLAGRLRPGENLLEVTLRRPLGPPLLWLASDGVASPEVASGPHWTVSRAGAPESPAALADDTRTLPEARGVPSAPTELARLAPLLLASFAASALAAALALRHAGASIAPAPPRLALGAVVLLWLLVFVRKTLDVPLLAGFDAGGHWEYVQWLVLRHSVPLATDGWSLYHPPLFYLAPAALVAWLGPLQQGSLGAALVKLVPFAGGLGFVLASAALARRVHRDDPSAQTFAIALAGLCPMTLYVSAYFSNESWSACLLALALAQAARIFETPSPRAGALAGLGLLLGAALLTKFTAVVVAPVVLLFVAVRLALDPALPLARAAGLTGLAVAVALVVSGAFYARNLVLLGQLLPSNWGELEVASGRWWQQPGFHTARWYLGFGESLVHPWFAGFASFSDALYSTLWGDGYIAGRVFLRDRLPQWNHAWMAATYPLALPATALIGAGLVRGALASLRDARPARRLTRAMLATLAFVLLAALASVSLRYPYYAQVKAFYVLPIAVPFAVLGADGFAAVDRALARRASVVPRALFLGACATLGVAIAWTYAG